MEFFQELVFENDDVKVFANDKGLQVSKKDGSGTMRWVQYPTFFKEPDLIDKLDAEIEKLKKDFAEMESYNVYHKAELETLRKTKE